MKLDSLREEIIQRSFCIKHKERQLAKRVLKGRKNREEVFSGRIKKKGFSQTKLKKELKKNFPIK